MGKKLTAFILAVIVAFTPFLTAGAQVTEYRFYDPSDTPNSCWLDDEGGPLKTVGLKFSTSSNGYVVAGYFYRGSDDTQSHLIKLWTGSGELLGSVYSGTGSGEGWKRVNFVEPIYITAGSYVISDFVTPLAANCDDYDYENNLPGEYFINPVISGPLSTGINPTVEDTEGLRWPNRDLSKGDVFPDQGSDYFAYYIDLAFQPEEEEEETTPAPTTAPGIEEINMTPIFTQASGVINGLWPIFATVLGVIFAIVLVGYLVRNIGRAVRNRRR